MVDIDGELIRYTKKYLPMMYKGSFNFSKVRVIIEDGFRYISESKGSEYDVVIIDATDPYGPEIGRKLYSIEFYTLLVKTIKRDGIVVTQADNSFHYRDVYLNVLHNIKKVFKIVREYWVWRPLYSYACNFIIASNYLDLAKLAISDIDKRLMDRDVKVKLYSSVVHQGLMKLGVITRT